jgi:hypothetical protein
VSFVGARCLSRSTDRLVALGVTTTPQGAGIRHQAMPLPSLRGALATKQPRGRVMGPLGCFAALAMTGRDWLLYFWASPKSDSLLDRVIDDDFDQLRSRPFEDRWQDVESVCGVDADSLEAQRLRYPREIDRWICEVHPDEIIVAVERA